MICHIKRTEGRQPAGRGSFTIEAAVLMPILMNLVLLILYMGFYWYNTAVCAYACYTYGRSWGIGSGEQTPEEMKKELEKQVLGMKSLEIDRQQEGEKMIITVKGAMQIPVVNRTLVIEERQLVYRLDQRAYILKYDLILDPILPESNR